MSRKISKSKHQTGKRTGFYFFLFFFYLFTSSWADPDQLEHNSNLEGRVSHSSNGHCALFLSSLTRPPAMYSFPPLSALCDFFGLAGGCEPNVLLPRYPWSIAMIQGCPMRGYFLRVMAKFHIKKIKGLKMCLIGLASQWWKPRLRRRDCSLLDSSLLSGQDSIPSKAHGFPLTQSTGTLRKLR